MADYTTVEAVRGILSRDATKTAPGTAASLDDIVIQQQISDAQARVDSALGNIYTVPFTVVPEIVAQITRDIAAYLSDLVFRQSKDYSSKLDPVYLRYQDAIALLASIASGQTTIPGQNNSGGIAVENPYAGDLFVPLDFDLQRGPRREQAWRYPW